MSAKSRSVLHQSVCVGESLGTLSGVGAGYGRWVWVGWRGGEEGAGRVDVLRGGRGWRQGMGP